MAKVVEISPEIGDNESGSAPRVNAAPTLTSTPVDEVNDGMATDHPTTRRRLNVLFPNLPPYWVPGVYLLWRNGVVVYVGQSANVRDRIMVNSLRFQVDTLSFIVVSDRRERMDLERRLIRQHRPIENGVYPVVIEAEHA